ncbi:5-oxoprolinase subunit PxpB [Marinobacter nauticus]|uniref:KipI family sensor histidine kinase inhibitor n=1 Tax=Marinobacter nauticus TaxID=2743 RepID=A0A368UXP6_MARNT|nr:5-oxoprolinase subunit PxpB [Marinobacter nauticus]RBP71836.1 KipI family sensor histidine kinase inhibitor [Marinobacter nauticus]RCW32855.1 KipI family sensor histidine kinase inhibitor [Marinobacter nauticus]TPW25586.1 5-oxoprolinase subunit PxpB [Marinobacter nauticus]
MIEPVSEDTILITLAPAIDDTLPARIASLVDNIWRAGFHWLVDMVPSYTTLMVVYDPVAVDFRQVTTELRPLVHELSTLAHTAELNGRLVELPVYYSAETGPDLQWLASESGLDCEEVIRRHSSVEYRVHALGFAPGFAFMGQVDPSIAAPRKTSPRKQVPAGSVGIADRQTAVYPQASPGGWQLIGRCPTSLFDPTKLSLLKVGDRVRFTPISREAFLATGGELTP